MVALQAALLLTIRILGDRAAYSKSKLHPHSAYRKFVHWLLTDFRPLKSGLDRRQQFTIQDAEGKPWVIRRIVNKPDGNYRVVTPLDGDAQAIARQQRRFDYDLCISFAGENRQIASDIAKSIQDTWGGSKIFLDEFEKWNLWGRDLTSMLYNVYSRQSRLCLIVISSDYLRKAWPKHELRAAYARMVQEGVGYILPFIVDDSQPPQELETISYLRSNETSIAELGQRLGDRIFEEGYQDWMVVEDLAEALASEFRFNTMIHYFREALEAEPSPEEALAKALLALIWTTETPAIAATKFFEYLLFDFEPLSKRFDHQGQYLAIPPHGKVRRWTKGDGVLIMPTSYWNPIFEEAKAGNPLFSDSKEDNRPGEGPSE